ncbi:MAG: cryptochrome/photolyase family protein [Candidatus Puniceispirillales bacterium]|jgi:deoxyribodipyrimidine photolyase-related protein|nr:cryptochrome/photolyase family protein [Alphaproteobacteria bacterium]MBL6850637.1 cryptochrome/photolyase family protein [Alphaproteobacteria bacterium]
MQTNNLLLILGNQLFPLEYIKKTKVKKIFMAEDFSLTTYQKHHKLKILMFLWSMRQYRDQLVKNGFIVYYNSIDDKNFKDTYENKLLKILKDEKVRTISYFEIEDHFFEDRFNKFVSDNNLETKLFQSPMFLNSRSQFVEFAKTQKSLIKMASFYQKMRIKMSILIDNNKKPIGGKWSFDEENRKKISGKIKIPKVPINTEDQRINNLKHKINVLFRDHPGSADYLWMPTNREEALKWMEIFFQNKFHDFGTYEDAIIDNNNFLYHSALSPIINMGLLTPKEIVEKAINFSKKNSIPLNSLEGFIRQIIGWREFIRGIYHYKGKEEKKLNFWQHNRKLTKDWYEGTTGIKPLDDVINDCLKYGYTHHIPRLMIVCNIMNLSRIHPDEIYKWFMEMFVDSSDWVMVPNVYGMGTFADGGIFATKPYSCGSNYILKMSNYKKDEWCDIVDGLYWKFMSDNLSFFKTNPRLSILVKSVERMNEDRKNMIFEKATNFIDNKTIKN